MNISKVSEADVQVFTLFVECKVEFLRQQTQVQHLFSWIWEEGITLASPEVHACC